MAKLFIENPQLRGKRVLMRVDFNVPIKGLKYLRLGALAVAVTLMASCPGPVWAEPASSTLLPAIDRALAIVFRDDAPKGSAAVRAALEGVVDFDEAARRALGPHWQARSDAERAEFVALFKDLMASSYLATMRTHLGRSVRLVAENEDSGFATVLTQMQRPQGPPSPVEYRMHHRDGRWLIFDVRVDGVSLVAAYRRQFDTIVQTSSYAELLHRVQNYLAQMASTAPGSPAAGARRARWRTGLRMWTIEVVAQAAR
jgi:phospholipid transport system substrate-binding protein